VFLAAFLPGLLPVSGKAAKEAKFPSLKAALLS